MASAQSTSGGTSLVKGAKSLWIIAIVIATLVTGGIFTVMSQVASTTTYYVLNQAIPARTMIAPNMMSAVVTTSGGQPGNAFDLADVQTGEVYSKFALERGDVVSRSNAGELVAITEGIPDSYVVASFSVEPERAVAGRVVRGSYIDVIAVTVDPNNGDERAKYILRNVLVLDVNSDLAAASNSGNSSTGATASDSAGARNGVPTLYTVGLSPQDSITLALAQNDTIMIVLSPVANVQNGVNPEDISGNQGDIFGDAVIGDSSEGTDSSFGTDGKGGVVTPTPEPGVDPSVKPSVSPGTTLTPTPTPTPSS